MSIAAATIATVVAVPAAISVAAMAPTASTPIVAPVSAAAAPAPTVPGTNAQKDAVSKPLRAVISVGSACIRIVVVIAIRTGRLRIIAAAVVAIIATLIARAADAESQGHLGPGIGRRDQQNPKQRDVP
jgi:hypothetical protein